MGIPNNWRNQHRERELRGWFDPETHAFSFDGVHWIIHALAADTQEQAKRDEKAAEQTNHTTQEAPAA